MQSFSLEHFDRKRLDELNSLPGDLILQLMQIFVESTPSLLIDLETAAADGAEEMFWRSAHALKSSSLNIGAAKLAQHCLHAEELGKKSQLHQARQFLPQLKVEYATVLNFFQSQLKKKL